MKALSILAVTGLLHVGASAFAQTPTAGFEAAVAEYSSCMIATVRMGMTTRMAPAEFRAGLDKSCKTEEARSRAAALNHMLAQGRTEAEAAAEIDGNLVRARAAWAEDQETYIRTGKVPR